MPVRPGAFMFMLVIMTVDPKDRRGRRLALTNAGRKVLRTALPIWQRAHEDVDRLLTPRAGKQVRAALRALSSSTQS